MGLKKAQDPRIDPQNPWENDDLQREREGQLLSRLIASLTGPYVVAVKGSWGTGKSVFLRRLSAQLEMTGIPVIPIDAWRTDYLDDPLIAFVSATESRIAEKRDKHDAVIQKGKEIAISLAGHAAKLVPTLAAVAADAHVPGAGTAVKAGAESLAACGDAVLNSIKAKKDAEARFREKLSEARDFLTEREKLRPIRPVVVAIDELDRCRPNYAVKVLERIKHYFDVPGVIFVIATDGTNLPNAVASVYGDKIDGELYLRKFFDYEFDLQNPDPQKFVRVLTEQYEFDTLIGTSRLDETQLRDLVSRPTDTPYGDAVAGHDRGLDAVEVICAFPIFAKHFALSLRDQAQAFTLINAYFRTLSDRVITYPVVVTFIYCLRFYDPALFQRLRNGQAHIEEMFTARGEPPLLKDGGILQIQSTFGRELALFCSLVRQEHPDVAVQTIFSNAHNVSPYDGQYATAATRLYFRVKADDGALNQFLGRVFTLADAFS